MTSSNRIGERAEAIALAYLQAQGLQPIAHNFHSRYGEIDLIMLEPASSCLCFIEVRARKQDGLVSAVESVDDKKQQKTILTAQTFLQKYPQYEQYECRFDVIAIEYQNTQDLLKNFIEFLQQQTVNLQWIKHAYMM